jgi:hypothetical protein
MGSLYLGIIIYGVGALVGFLAGAWYMAGEKNERYSGRH